jgi:hypothetical protein
MLTLEIENATVGATITMSQKLCFKVAGCGVAELRVHNIGCCGRWPSNTRCAAQRLHVMAQS